MHITWVWIVWNFCFDNEQPLNQDHMKCTIDIGYDVMIITNFDFMQNKIRNVNYILLWKWDSMWARPRQDKEVPAHKSLHNSS